MKRSPLALSTILLAALLLASCSGTHNTVTPPASGNATVSVTFTDTPPAGVSILSFTITLSGLALNPSSGAPVNFTLSPNPLSVELTRLQSDSFLGATSAAIPAGTYSGITVAVASSKIVFLNGTAAAIGSCTAGSLCTVSPISAASVTYTFPAALSLTSGQQTGIALDFNLNNAITAALGVDFTVAGAVTATNLPHTGTPASTLDLIEDFTGTVTAYNSSTGSLTVQSGTRGTLTGIVGSGTLYHDPLATCVALNSTCLHTGQTLSVNAGLNLDGTLAIREVDLIDSTSVDVLEGTIYKTPGTTTSFSMVLSDKVVVTSSNTALTGAAAGDTVNLSWSAAPTFAVDTAGMTLSSSFPSNLALFTGGADSSVLYPGQTVMVTVTGATASLGVVSATATRILLRHSRFTATVNTVLSNSFSINAAALPPFFGSFGATIPLVEVFPNVTSYDNVAGSASLAAADVVSLRALYIQNPGMNSSPMFFATKVRKH
ncbi:MAG: DUF4382 domain-containing protein [Acidobacteriia bacterium]|nr:DUF4382 domain-containing protein [Terriglobia bacterium]